MEYVSDRYKHTLDNLAESLMANRREKLAQEISTLALADTQPIVVQ